jgi:choline dehydrogenase-like flavoprotein
MSRDDNAVLEFPIQAGGSVPLVYTKMTSRGTVLMNATHRYAEPLLDYRTFTSPVDVRIAADAVRFTRRFWTTPSGLTFGAVEQAPGQNLTSDEDLIAAARRSTGASTAHLSGTCSMMPRELGGVVSPELLVYGVTGLSVADSSVMPLIPGAHICATVYAVAEKAVDIIRKRHGLKS